MDFGSKWLPELFFSTSKMSRHTRGWYLALPLFLPDILFYKHPINWGQILDWCEISLQRKLKLKRIQKILLYSLLFVIQPKIGQKWFLLRSVWDICKVKVWYLQLCFPNLSFLTILSLLAAYETSYGNSPVWKTYGRNYKGHWDPDTRKTCVVSYYIVYYIIKLLFIVFNSFVETRYDIYWKPLSDMQRWIPSTRLQECRSSKTIHFTI